MDRWILDTALGASSERLLSFWFSVEPINFNLSPNSYCKRPFNPTFDELTCQNTTFYLLCNKTLCALPWNKEVFTLKVLPFFLVHFSFREIRIQLWHMIIQILNLRSLLSGGGKKRAVKCLVYYWCCYLSGSLVLMFLLFWVWA